MKKFLLLFIAFSGYCYSQIQLEHHYDCFLNLHQVGPNEFKYACIDNDVLKIYDINHNLEKSINVPPQSSASSNVALLSKNLFNSDGKYEFIVFDNGSAKVMNEDLQVILDLQGFTFIQAFNTSDGPKLVVKKLLAPHATRIYSLPGQLFKVEELDALEFPVSPNPSSGKVSVAIDRHVEEIKIVDVAGREVYTEKVGGFLSKKELDVYGLSAGAYMLMISTDTGTKAQRIVIQ